MKPILILLVALATGGCAVVRTTAAIGSAAVSVGSAAVSVGASAVGLAADAVVGTAKVVGSAVTPDGDSKGK
jgi:glutamyl-tRNA reductase